MIERAEGEDAERGIRARQDTRCRVQTAVSSPDDDDGTAIVTQALTSDVRSLSSAAFLISAKTPCEANAARISSSRATFLTPARGLRMTGTRVMCRASLARNT
jgi:hypothetical protein